MIVIDSGHVINPHNAAEQLEGSVAWELSHAWLGGLEMQEGRFAGPPLPRPPQADCRDRRLRSPSAVPGVHNRVE